jgi:predicted O-methyltransferase YrrM
MVSLTWGPVDCGRGVTLDTSLTPAERDELQWLAAGWQVLEVGSCFGYSALVLAGVAEHVFAVDPHMEQRGGIPGSLPKMREALRVFELEHKVTMCLSFSQDVLCHLLSIGARFGLIFIDADHNRPAVEHDLDHSLRLLDEHGALCFHDYGFDDWPDVKTVLDERYPDGPTRVIDSLWVLER